MTGLENTHRELKDLMAAFIGRWIKKAESSQQALALEWWESCKEELKRSTVETRLSGLRNGELTGVRFFFNNRERAVLLLKLLEVPKGEYDGIFAAAEAALKGLKVARIVVLATKGQFDPVKGWGPLRRFLEVDKTPRPAIILVDEEVNDAAPRSLDKIKECDVVEEEEASAQAELLALVTDAGGLVVAPLKPKEVPVHQWVAVNFSDELSEAAPANWRTVWGAGGLAPLEAPAFRLDELDFTISDDEAPALRGPALREALVRVVEGTYSGTVAARLALAKRWDVVPGATAEEHAAWVRRVEDAEIKAAAETCGVEIEQLDAEGWEVLMVRAKVTYTQVVAHVGDEWRWLNVTPPDGTVADNERVHSEVVEAPESALTRLWDKVKDWNVEQRAADPLFEDAAAELDPEGTEQKAFELARCYIALGEAPKGWPHPMPEPEVVEDPVAALKTLVSGPTPEVELLMPATTEAESKLFLAVKERLARSVVSDLNLSVALDPLSTVRMRRGQTLVVVDRDEPMYEEPKHKHEFPSPECFATACSVSAGMVPTQTPLVDLPVKAFTERLLCAVVGQMTGELLTASVAHHSRQQHYRYDRIDLATCQASALWPRSSRQAWSANESIEVGEIWPRVDLAVTQLRDVLRRALDETQPIMSPDGQLVIPLRPGLDAVVKVRAHKGSVVGTGCAVCVGMESNGHRNKLVLQDEKAWSTFPREVELRKDGVRATVRLAENPYSGDAGGGRTLHAILERINNTREW